jgi:hypothetical protein
LEELWKWIDADVDKRAWFVAWFIPSFISKTEDESSVARELLIRYGDRDDVRRNLFANFGTTKGVITGSFSSYYQHSLEELSRIREREDHPNVLSWLDEYIGDLEVEVEVHRIREEREF